MSEDEKGVSASGTSGNEAEKKLQENLSRKQERARKRAEKHEKQRRLLFPANKKGMHIMPMMNVFRVLLYPLHALLYPFRLHGHKRVGKGACIFVGNHYCLWDVFYPAHTTWEGVHFLAKESILHAPVLGYWARRLGVIGAMRDGSDVRTLMESMKVLKNGEKVSMFPEGTRNRGDGEEFLPFRGGAALMAIKTKTPVVPFVICNKPKLFRMTHVVFGEPMELSQYYGRKLTPDEYAEAEDVLKNRLYALRDQFRSEQAEKRMKKRKKACR